MSLPAAPLIPSANNRQSVGHPEAMSQSFSVINTSVGSRADLAVQQTDTTTAGSCAVLSFQGQLPSGSGGGPTGSASYVFTKGVGPAAGGIVPDHLQLFRYGPAGAVAPLSEILDIAPKMVATPGSPTVDTMTINTDLILNGTLSGGFASTTNYVDEPNGISSLRCITIGPYRIAFGQSTPLFQGTDVTVGLHTVPAATFPGQTGVGLFGTNSANILQVIVTPLNGLMNTPVSWFRVTGPAGALYLQSSVNSGQVSQNFIAFGLVV